MWTRFMDMHSGGGTKEGNYDTILIQAPEDEATIIFYNRFGHSPTRVSCTCCGDDYSITSEESFSQITAYDRHCADVYIYVDDGTVAAEGRNEIVGYDPETRKMMCKGREVKFEYAEKPNLSTMKYGASKAECIERYKTVAEYVELPEVLVISEEDIKDDERRGSIPQSGYVWVD